MVEQEIIARVERDRQQARVDQLLSTLRSLARFGDDIRPVDSISADDAKLCYDRQEAWHDGHSAGVETGRWLAGNVAQEAIDEWERGL